MTAGEFLIFVLRRLRVVWLRFLWSSARNLRVERVFRIQVAPHRRR